MTILLLGLFGCRDLKEKQDPDLGSWLERHYPDEFIIVDNARSLKPRDYFEKKISSIVGSTRDPEVQFKIIWYKDRPDLGVTTAEIDTAFMRSKKDIAHARSFSKAIQQNGINKVSVGVIDEALYILPFSDPTRETREAFTRQILELLKHREDQDQTSIWIEWMEDSIYGKEFADVIPEGYWFRGDTYHDRHKIMSLEFEITPELNADDLIRRWKFNTGSDRSMQFIEIAYSEALQWAEKNLRKPFYLERDQLVQVELDADDGMLVHYHFPLLEEQTNLDTIGAEEKVMGYVTGDFSVDERKFSHIRKVKEI
jgi:hypothetical protein